MAAQPQENRYEVKMWSNDRDPETGEGYFRVSGRRKFTLLPDAIKWAWERWMACEEHVVGIAIFDQKKLVVCHGLDYSSAEH